MNRKYSISHLTALQLSPPELIYLADRVGFDYVSLRTICMGLGNEPDYTLSKNPYLFKMTRNALASTNITLLDIELARIYDGRDVRSYERSLEIAAELGAKHVITSVWTDDKSYAVEQYDLLCGISQQYGLTVDLEYVPISNLTTLAAVVDVLHQVNQPNKGILIDIHHFHRAQDRVEELAKLPTEWFNFIHLCDASEEIPDDLEEIRRVLREERSYIGEGGIDVHSIVDALPNIPFSIELPHLKRLQELGPDQFAKNCLESAKRYFSGGSQKMIK